MQYEDLPTGFHAVPLAPGRKLGARYEILREIGRGGMGVVYLARDLDVDLEVVLKVLPPEIATNRRAVEDLKREASISIRLNHPNIVRVYNTDEIDGTRFVAMEYVDGETLAARLDRDGPLSEGDFLKVGIPVCDALAHAHAHKVIHRDLKPANIIVSKKGQVKVMDFGIARVVKDSTTRLTGKTPSGTLLYMAPEQIQGARGDARSDIWSLGITFYEILVGEPPFVRGDITHQILTKAPAPLATLRPEILGAMAEAVAKALSKDPEGRFQSVSELKAALESKTAPSPPSRVGVGLPTRRTRKLLWATAGAVLLAIAGWAVKSHLERLDQERQAVITARAEAQKIAEEERRKAEDAKRKTEEERRTEVEEKQRAEQERKRQEEDQKKAETERRAKENSRRGRLPPAGGSDIRRDARSQEGATRGGMVLVPAGDFFMGCKESVDNGCNVDERPYHKVYLDTFYIDKTEVTVRAYERCVSAGSCSAPSTTKYCNWDASGRGDHPINCVDWNQANAYCAWSGKRLPTEAEWEKAARGADGRKYPWGNAQASCRYAVMHDGGNGCGRDSTWPVGSKLEGASPYGALDMAGNVWEWVSNWYGEMYYSGSPPRNPEGPSLGHFRVLRGGSWSYVSRVVRGASTRYYYLPAVRYGGFGFRCARTGS